jgi:hypothetical protein
MPPIEANDDFRMMNDESFDFFRPAGSLGF